MSLRILVVDCLKLLLPQTITRYLIALYWSVVTYTTVGYGDLSPVNEAERAYAILVMV